jgi:hypothetical protein
MGDNLFQGVVDPQNFVFQGVISPLRFRDSFFVASAFDRLFFPLLFWSRMKL